MEKVYTRLPIVTILVVILGICGLAFLTQPRIRAYLPGQPEQALNDFVQTTVKNQNVDPKVYWQFREFYSRGNFSFDPRVVSFGETQIISALPDPQTVLLKYTAPRLQSVDYIVQLTNGATSEQQMMLAVGKAISAEPPQTKVLMNTDTATITQDAQYHYVLVFAKSIADMRTANGFFDYTAAEQKLLQNTFWLNVTHIQ